MFRLKTAKSPELRSSESVSDIYIEKQSKNKDIFLFKTFERKNAYRTEQCTYILKR